MAICKYCNGRVGYKHNRYNGIKHQTCWDEWNRRYENGLCIWCGKQEKEFQCNYCGICDGKTYTGYNTPMLKK